MPICRTVSQISPPIRIVLVATIGLIAAWMLFLRPGAEPTPAPAPAPAPATAPGAEGLGNAVDRAEDAAAAQEARDEKLQQATGERDGAPGSAKAGATRAEAALATGRVLALAPLDGKATKELPAGIRRALVRRQVFAIGVFNLRSRRWRASAPEDRRVRRALARANRYGGRVTVHIAALGELSRLRPVLGDLDVVQSPSVVVVDRNRRATLLEGYVDRISINQAIADARRDSIAFRIKDAYRSRLNETCANYSLRLDRFDLPRSRSGIRPALGRLSRLVATYRAGFGRLNAPRRWRPLQGQIMEVLRRQDDFIASLRAGNLSQAGRSLTALDLAASGLDRRLDRAGVTNCVTHRRS
jgi:hypothetical protein